MRAGMLCAVLSTAVFTACFIDKPTETLECVTTEDCSAVGSNRTCEEGYCVVTASCPEDCTSCNVGMRTCLVECNDTDDCDSAIVCPSGWTCTISCNGDSACNDVQCSSGSRCTVTCNGANACDDVDCDAACQCDVECAAGACQSTSCPVRGNGANQVQCTVDGTQGTSCDSARAASCASC